MKRQPLTLQRLSGPAGVLTSFTTGLVALWTTSGDGSLASDWVNLRELTVLWLVIATLLAGLQCIRGTSSGKGLGLAAGGLVAGHFGFVGCLILYDTTRGTLAGEFDVLWFAVLLVSLYCIDRYWFAPIRRRRRIEKEDEGEQ